VAQQQQRHFSSGQAAAARQQRSLMQLPHAVKDEEAEIDRITKEAGQSDIWGNEVVGNAVKVSASILALTMLQKSPMLSHAWFAQQCGLPS
jgi:hypothetical protein